MAHSGNMSPSPNLLPIISSRDYRQAPELFGEQPPNKVLSPRGLAKFASLKRQLPSPKGTLVSLRNNPASIYMKNQHPKESPPALLPQPLSPDPRRHSPDFTTKATMNIVSKQQPGGVILPSTSLSPMRLPDDELNSDIVMLMNSPRNPHGRNVLEPLSVQVSMTNSLDSSQTQLQRFSNRPSFNYPPDLHTANEMIKQSQQVQSSLKGNQVLVTDYNTQCVPLQRNPSNHRFGEPRSTIADSELRAQVNQILALQQNDSYELPSPRSPYKKKPLRQQQFYLPNENYEVLPISSIEEQHCAQMTVKNANLFSMMQQNASRENIPQLKTTPSSRDLQEMMGSLQTYKNKKRDPTKRVNIPYYHKVISRSRHKHALSAAANPNSSIMLSKQLTLLERKTNPNSPTYSTIKIPTAQKHHKAKSLVRRGLSKISASKMQRATAQHFAMCGIHQCGKQCAQQIEQALADIDSVDSDLEFAIEREDEITEDKAEYNSISDSSPDKDAENQLSSALIISSNKKKLVSLNRVGTNKRLSQSMLPKTTDINAQQEQLLPQISITNKKLTQVTPTARYKKARKVVLSAYPRILHASETDGCDTDGVPFRSPFNSMGEHSADSGSYTVLQSGTVTLQEVKPEVVFSHISTPAKMSTLPKILRMDDKSKQVFVEGEIQPKNRFNNQKLVKANFNNDLLNVAADKVHSLEIHSVGSHDSVMSNGERVQRILRPGDKTRSSTCLVDSVLKGQKTPKVLKKTRNILLESLESPILMSSRALEANI